MAVRLLRTDGRLRQKEYLDSLFHAAYRREVIAKVGGLNENLGEPRIMNFTTALEWRATRYAVAPILFRISIHETTFTE